MADAAAEALTTFPPVAGVGEPPVVGAVPVDVGKASTGSGSHKSPNLATKYLYHVVRGFVPEK